jgi:hypothetical protein
MIRREMEAWSRWASPDSVTDVALIAVDAMGAWPMWCSNRELDDVAPWCPSAWEWSARWTEAAALAAAELAIICSIWPDQLNEVLRPERTVHRP